MKKTEMLKLIVTLAVACIMLNVTALVGKIGINNNWTSETLRNSMMISFVTTAVLGIIFLVFMISKINNKSKV